MAIHQWDGIDVGDGHVVRLNADKRTIPLVGVVNREIATATAALVHQPEIRDRGRKWRRDAHQSGLQKVWKSIVKEEQEAGRVNVEHDFEKHDVLELDVFC